MRAREAKHGNTKRRRPSLQRNAKNGLSQGGRHFGIAARCSGPVDLWAALDQFILFWVLLFPETATNSDKKGEGGGGGKLHFFGLAWREVGSSFDTTHLARPDWGMSVMGKDDHL